MTVTTGMMIFIFGFIAGTIFGGVLAAILEILGGKK